MDDPNDHATAREAGRPDDMTQKDPSILLLSPDEGTRATLRELLHPIPVRETVSVEAAAQAAADHSFDILVLDIDDMADLDAIVDCCYGGSTTPIVLAIAPRDDGEALLERVEAGVLYRFVFKPFLAGQARLAMDATLTRHAQGSDPILDIEDVPMVERGGDSRLVLVGGGVSAVAVLAAAGLFLGFYGEDDAGTMVHTPVTPASGQIGRAATPTEPAVLRSPDATAAPSAGSVAPLASVRRGSVVSSGGAAGAAQPVDVDTDVTAVVAALAGDGADAEAGGPVAEEVPAASSVAAAFEAAPGAEPAAEPAIDLPELDDTLVARALARTAEPAPGTVADNRAETTAIADTTADLSTTAVAPSLDDQDTSTPAVADVAEFAAVEPDTTESVTARTPTPGDSPAETRKDAGSAAFAKADTIGAPVEDETLDTTTEQEFNLAALSADVGRPLPDTLSASASAPSAAPAGSGPVLPAQFGDTPAPVDRDAPALATLEPAGSEFAPDDVYTESLSDTVEAPVVDTAPAAAAPSPWSNPDAAGSSLPVDGPDSPPAAQLPAPGGNAEAENDLVRTVYATPVYPRAALQRNIEGWVTVRFTVGPDGVPGNIEVIDAKPRKTFDRAAVRAVRDWRYEPPVEDGQYVWRDTEVRIEFALK